MPCREICPGNAARLRLSEYLDNSLWEYAKCEKLGTWAPNEEGLKRPRYQIHYLIPFKRLRKKDVTTCYTETGVGPSYRSIFTPTDV